MAKLNVVRGGGQSGTGLSMPGKVRLLLCAGCLALTSPAFAAATDQVLELDPKETKITFRVGGTLHTVVGTFGLRRGEIGFSPQGGAATGRVVVDARSGDTGSGLRDRRMRGELLDSENFPDISFAPTSLQVEAIDADSARVRLRGAMNIRGAEHALVVGGTVRRLPDGRVHIEAEFSVPYIEWGMPDMSNFLLHVDPTVEVSVVADARIYTP